MCKWSYHGASIEMEDSVESCLDNGKLTVLYRSTPSI